MTSNLLHIAESSHEAQIDEEKLKFICSKHNIWDYFKMSKSQYLSYSNNEKMQMLHRFYNELVLIWYGQGMLFVCCKNCVWFQKQDCLRCKVNVIYCTCSFDDEEFFSPIKKNSTMNRRKREKKFWSKKWSQLWYNYQWNEKSTFFYKR